MATATSGLAVGSARVTSSRRHTMPAAGASHTIGDRNHASNGAVSAGRLRTSATSSGANASP